MQPLVESDYLAARDSRVHSAEYVARVTAALRSHRDVWGESVLANAPDGVAWEDVSDLLTPSFLADPVYQTPVPYLPLTDGVRGTSFALHLIDGSQILAEGIRNWLIQGAVLPNGEEAERAHKPARVRDDAARWFFSVGASGDEQFGADLARLDRSELADGYLPILELAYRDEAGVRYRRTSFVTTPATDRPLTNWLRFTVETHQRTTVTLRVRVDAPSFGELRADEEVTAASGVVLTASHPFDWDGEAAVFRLELEPGRTTTLELALPLEPDPRGSGRATLSAEFDAARAAVAETWTAALEAGALVEVPDARVVAATKSLVLQNLVMGHRYSIGNPYERAFLAEGHLATQPLLWFGHHDRYREQLRELLDLTNGSGAEWYESWERGTKLSAIAEYVELTGDGEPLTASRATYRGYVDALVAQLATDPRGLLSPERYAWDIPEVVYGAHSQSVAWRGLVDAARVFRATGDPLGEETEAAITRFGESLRTALREAAVELPDGSTFIPVVLGSDAFAAPFDFLPETRHGNYWTLVFPYALATGILPSAGPELPRLQRYLDLHGGFLLGLARFSGLYEPIPQQGEVFDEGTAGYKVAGIDNAFGLQQMRVLADLGEADRLALTLYSKLAHGMTRGTHLDGEATTVGAVPGEYHRSSWYPPNSTSNALFLVTLRLMLLHEARADGRLEAVSLAPSTPRHWLRSGQRISVARLPSAVGDVAYSLDSRLDDGAVDVRVELTPGRPPIPVSLDVRAPRSHVIAGVDGPDAAAVTLDGERLVLDPAHDSFALTIRYTRQHHS